METQRVEVMFPAGGRSISTLWGSLLQQKVTKNELLSLCIGNMGVSKNSGFSPQFIHGLIGVSIIFTIHFGGKPPIFGKHPYLTMYCLQNKHVPFSSFAFFFCFPLLLWGVHGWICQLVVDTWGFNECYAERDPNGPGRLAAVAIPQWRGTRVSCAETLRMFVIRQRQILFPWECLGRCVILFHVAVFFLLGTSSQGDSSKNNPSMFFSPTHALPLNMQAVSSYQLAPKQWVTMSYSCSVSTYVLMNIYIYVHIYVYAFS